jgi:4-diphosphocytidyl-2-C-methyl-D-erythritol kinase
LTRDAARRTIAGFLSGAVRGNAFEPVLRRLQPRVDSVLATLSRFGEACLTGTGGGVSSASPRARRPRRRDAGCLPASTPGWRTASARSPLLDARVAQSG